MGLDDFLALGLIVLAYGVALLAHAYGFLAVFAAGLALRRVERQHTEESEGAGEAAPADVTAAAAGEEAEALATHPEKAPAYMAQAVLGFNEQLERIGEVAVVILLGAMLSWGSFTLQTVAFVAVLLLVLRPLAVSVGPPGERPLRDPAGPHRLVRDQGHRVALLPDVRHPARAAGRAGRHPGHLTLATVAVSIVVHGVSVTPLMGAYRKRGA